MIEGEPLAATQAGHRPRAAPDTDAYAQIKSRILARDLIAGAHVPEHEIARAIGTSRTPVREALIRLEAEGLVRVIPRRGVHILPVDAADMREIYTCLAGLEGQAAADIAQAIASGQTGVDALTSLDQASQRMAAALRAGDATLWAEADDQFHRTLVQMSGNQRMGAMTDALYAQAHRTQGVTLKMRRDLAVSSYEHTALQTAIRAGQPDEARATAVAHRERGAMEIIGLLEAIGLPPL